MLSANLAFLAQLICQGKQSLEAELEVDLSVDAHHLGDHIIGPLDVTKVDLYGVLGLANLTHERQPTNTRRHILQTQQGQVLFRCTCLIVLQHQLED